MMSPSELVRSIEFISLRISQGSRDVTETPRVPKKLVWISIVFSVIMGANGMSSIVSGFYTYGEFFTDIIETYQHFTAMLFYPLKLLFNLTK